ncbi:MAG: imidazole glycerol phosphate synthase subunit HisH [Selenomonadaceae bacterium]|nr:imidazole glycerol phosphate synthase subunit HisH [Selenomonadaceae bacterium]
MIAVIDYGVGNLFSVEKALIAMGADVEVTKDAGKLRAAEKIVLPGVGAFGDCMKNLEATGLVPVLKEELDKGKPLLGICVGLQILFDGSEESPGVRGLGLLPGMVRKIEAPGLKVPHMGWNSLDFREPGQEADLFAGLERNPYVYFVHSYHAVPEDAAIITATTSYGSELTAAVAKGNVQATQFHPEKSGDVGLKILRNFIEGTDGSKG